MSTPGWSIMKRTETKTVLQDTTNDPKQPGPTLTSLPEEVLVSIALHLDRLSALSLSLVSHSLTPAAITRIWQKIKIFLPDSDDTDPYPHGRRQSDAHALVLASIGLQAQDDGSKAAARWMSVREIKLTVGCFRSPEAELIMGRVAASLQTLIVAIQVQQSCSNHNFSLDSLILGQKFPSLTHVSLGRWTIQYAHVIPLLCDSAPALTSLDDHLTLDPLKDSEIIFVQRPTLLRRLRCEIYLPAGARIIPILVALLSQSPLLRQLSIDFCDAEIEGDENNLFSHLDRLRPVLDAMMRLAHLQDLHYPAHPGHFCRYVDAWCSASLLAPMPSLRRLVLECDCEEEVFLQLPSIPTLELVAFNHPHTHGRRTGGSKGALHFSSSSNLSASASGHVRLPNMDQLRYSPSLQYIFYPQDGINNYDGLIFAELDALERSADAPIRISSLRHGGAELLKVRFLVDDREKCDVDEAGLEPRPLHGGGFPNHYNIHYYAADGSGLRHKWFYRGAAPSWHDSYEFQGNPLPKRVVKRMRKVEGASKGDWEKRGVVVSDVAWAVLEDWVAEKKADGLWL